MEAQNLNESKTRIKEILLEEIETADLRKGSPLNEVYVTAGAALRTALTEQIDNFENTNNLKAIEENPDLASDVAVDAIVSNWLVERKTGSKARGTIKVNVNTQKQYFIPVDVPFSTAQGLNFFVFADTTVTEDQVFEDEVTETFYFLLSVQAENEGSEYEVEAETQLQTEILQGDLVLVSAYNDFFDGKDNETTEELLARGKTLISTRDLVSKVSINAFLQENFAEIIMSSIIGFQDREMQRGRNSLGIKTPGPVDIFIKPQLSASSKELEATTDSSGIFEVPTSESPILRVKDFALKTNPNNRFAVTDLTVESTKPSLKSKFARFSPFEKIKVQTSFVNTDILYTINTQPNVPVVNDFITSDTRKNLCTTTIAKLFIPVFVSVNVNFFVQDGAEVADDDTIKTGICDFINANDSGLLFASQITDVFHNFNIRNIELPITIKGTLYKPDGAIIEKESENKLYFDEEISQQISQKTYRFFCVKSDINIIRNIV